MNIAFEQVGYDHFQEVFVMDAVPRVGDHVCFHPDDDDHEVIKVIWCPDDPDYDVVVRYK